MCGCVNWPAFRCCLINNTGDLSNAAEVKIMAVTEQKEPTLGAVFSPVT